MNEFTKEQRSFFNNFDDVKDMSSPEKFNAYHEIKWRLMKACDEIDRLEKDYSIFEECSPPDVPRKKFVEDVFMIWQSGIVQEQAERIKHLEAENKELGEYKLIFDDDTALKEVIKLRKRIRELEDCLLTLKDTASSGDIEFIEQALNLSPREDNNETQK